VATLKTAAVLRAHLDRSGIALNFDDELVRPPGSPLAAPFELGRIRVGNRFCILPMEGWDGTPGGEPTELTRRRWRHFGASGAKLIWGGEAVAVRHDGRANPNQLLLTDQTVGSIEALREELVTVHRDRYGANADTDLFIGLQLTHSGRFSRPDPPGVPAPLAGCAHALLDRRMAGVHVLTDAELEQITAEFVKAARLAALAGFQFVDIKQCHGYLGHELLGARERPGAYGGSIENRTRFLRQIVEGVRAAAPSLTIGVRLSAFDVVPHRKGDGDVGVPECAPSETFAGFGVLEDEQMDEALEESRAVLRMLERLGVHWICVTAGSPYYSPHIQRPAFFPPVDGYQPPEDPLRSVARQIRATALLKAAFPQLVFVGSGYSYLQEWLPYVAQYNVRNMLTDFVGLGRIVLSYPGLAGDILSGVPIERRRICRTFSDCTTGPRMGFVSGCYPLDGFYTARAEADQIRQVRTEATVRHSSTP